MTAEDPPDPLAQILRALTAERFTPPPRRREAPVHQPTTYIDTPDIVRARIDAMNAEMTPHYSRAVIPIRATVTPPDGLPRQRAPHEKETA